MFALCETAYGNVALRDEADRFVDFVQQKTVRDRFSDFNLSFLVNKRFSIAHPDFVRSDSDEFRRERK